MGEKMKAKILSALTTCMLLLTTAAAGEESPGERILRQLDETLTRAQDQYFVQEMVTQEPGKEPRKLKMRAIIKGTEWRRVEFLEPGDVKGMKVLVRSVTQMYVYLPAYRKVRRVASHVRSQGFMGTTYSHDDISTVTYGPLYTAKLLSENDTHWTISLTLKPGKDYPYPKLEIEVLKNYTQASEIRYFNDKGVNVKTEKRSKFECREKICSPWHLKMVDHTRNGMWSEIVCLEWKVNTGVKDSYFTVRSLQRR
jgi:outer membrane lipoprotein-sorting protein